MQEGGLGAGPTAGKNKTDGRGEVWELQGEEGRDR